MPRIHPFIAVLSLCLASVGARATPINYGLQFHVQYVDSQMDSRLHVGNSYLGSLTVDDSLLSTDGINKVGSMSAFRIQMEDIVWDLDPAALANEFLGFRGPLGLRSSSPGFDVLAGSVTNLRGGVFGASDFPFVDFSTDTRGASKRMASPCDPDSMYCGNSANSFFTQNFLGDFGGSMLVYAIPEPATWLLLLIGLLGAFVHHQFVRRK